MITFLIMLIVIAVVDIKTMEIPNRFVVIIGIIGVMAMVFLDHLTLGNRLLGFICISLPLLVIALIKPGAIGGGDIKLMAVSGLYLGLELTILSFFIGATCGAIYGIGLLIKGKGRKEEFPLGPFLCSGMIIAIVTNLTVYTGR